MVIGLALNLCNLLASVSSPYMPETAESICKQLNTPLASIGETWTPDVLKAGHKIGKAAYLFSRIDDKKVAEWKSRFGGSAESRAAEEAAKKKKQEEKEKKKAKKAAKAAEAAKAAVGDAAAKLVGKVTGDKADGEVKGPQTGASGEIKDLPIRGKEKPN